MRFSWMTRTERQDVAPDITQVYLELSTVCNLACTTCVRNSIIGLKHAHADVAAIRRIARDLSRLTALERIVLLGFGEALCHPRIRTVLPLLRALRARIVLITNAHFLTPETADFLLGLPIDEIYISWDDSPSDEGAVIRRGADRGLFRRNLESIAERVRRDPAPATALGLEMVAMRSNVQHLPEIARYGLSIGISSFIVSNLYPYTEAMADEVLYSNKRAASVDLKRLFRGFVGRGASLRIANQNVEVPRACPFIERGTAFITAAGDVAPCPELAYPHVAYYFGSRRRYEALRFGNAHKKSLGDLWDHSGYAAFRENFRYYEFPDCSTCHDPDRCYHRTVEMRDCYMNPTPCGECLWSKGIVLCP